MKKTILYILAAFLLCSCAADASRQVGAHPSWTYNSVVYEMNVRQYTPEGTFAAAQKQLPRLKELGVDIIWLMPVYPIGELERKGTLGSYYAISDYCGINPEFGTMWDFRKFLKAAHRQGFKVILDWVANHTSPDARWIKEKPADWYERDSLGNTVVEYDWTDIAALNYDNRDVWAEMDKSMRFWLDNGVDGFRCDMACEVPIEFWQEVIPALRRDYPGIYMLAEGEDPRLHDNAFDASYGWELHHLLNALAQGKKGAEDLKEYIERDAEKYPEEAFRLMFTSNHDENSWAGTEFERMGDAAQAMAVLTFTLPGSQPLVYTGQEMGWNHRFGFFEKDPVPEWKVNEYTDFYKQMITLRHKNPALASGEKGGKFELISTEDDNFVFKRSSGNNVVKVSVQLKAPWKWEISTASDIPESKDRIAHVEPLSWWTGMKTPLQLMINGEGISSYNVSIEGGKGVKVKEIHKAESPDYLFVDVEIKSSAKPGTYYIVFEKDGDSFKYPYGIGQRRDASAQRKSFTTADMIYLIMPDRFANGDPSNDSTDDTAEKAGRNEFFGRHGGDIQGVIDHLDYISSLGATAVWSTPFLLDDEPDGSYHGYACADYYRIDPRFGTNELYREYVRKAHEKGIKIIMDVVTNHCGTAHWWMKDLPFADWVHQFPEYTGTNVCFSTNMDPNASEYDLHRQESGWFVPSMPDMNLDNPFMLQYFKQWAVWWIEYADLDGFRVDTYPYNEKRPMSEWCVAVLDEYPDFNIVGECWTSSIPQLAYWQGGNLNKDGFDTHLPSIMDFPLQESLWRALASDEGGWGRGMVCVYECLSHDFVYNDLSRMMIFPGNHDMDRIGDVLNKSVDRQKIAMAMMATMRGIPQIFYGDEMMFLSADRSQGHGGLRVDFPGGWEGDSMNLFTPQGRAAAKYNTDGGAVEPGQMADMFDYTSRLFQWRKGKKVIHDGKTLHFLSRDNVYSYFRYDDSDAVFVYINNSPEPKTLPWSSYTEIAEGLHDGRNVMTGESVTLDDTTVVGPRQVLIVEYVR